MDKFDIVKKIPLSLFVKAIISKTSEPEKALREIGFIRGDWHITGFDWGRNALYAFFAKISFKTIHFPAFTCPALTEAALAAGKRVELLEADLDTFNIDLNKLPEFSPECLVAVHTFGNPINMEFIRKKYPKAFIVEDCAHALFSKFDNKFVGNLGDAVLFSLYKQAPNFNGALLLVKQEIEIFQKKEQLANIIPQIIFKTSGWHQALINLLRKYKQHGDGFDKFCGGKSVNKLVEKTFVLELDLVKKQLRKARKIAGWYKKNVNNSPYLISQKVAEKGESSLFCYSVRLKHGFEKWRDKLVLKLRKENIFLDRLWRNAPVVDPRFSQFKNSCPAALKLAGSVLNLPINSKLSEKDVFYLVSKINQTIEQFL